MTTLLLCLSLSALAQSEEPAPAPAPAPAEEPQPEAPTLDTTGATPLTGLSDSQYRFLEPTKGRLDQDPYAQTDFTAYTLDWGEVKVGLASISVGVLPQTQLSTSPVLNAVGIYNVSGKVDAVRAGPLDLAGVGGYFVLPLDGFRGSRTFFGGLGSLQVVGGWSIHGGGQYDLIRGTGFPDISQLPMGTVMTSMSSEEISTWVAEAEARGVDLDLKVSAATLRFATDYRFNRRDSLILQFQSLFYTNVYGGVTASRDIPPMLGIGEMVSAAVAVEESKRYMLTENYVATLSYQASFNHLDLRVGGGWSAPVPYAWPLTAFDVSWRFGGATKAEERRLRKGWKKNRKVLGG